MGSKDLLFFPSPVRFAKMVRCCASTARYISDMEAISFTIHVTQVHVALQSATHCADTQLPVCEQWVPRCIWNCVWALVGPKVEVANYLPLCEGLGGSNIGQTKVQHIPQSGRQWYIQAESREDFLVHSERAWNKLAVNNCLHFESSDLLGVEPFWYLVILVNESIYRNIRHTPRLRWL